MDKGTLSSALQIYGSEAYMPLFPEGKVRNGVNTYSNRGKNILFISRVRIRIHKFQKKNRIEGVLF